MKVKEFMTKDVLTCSPEQTVQDAANLMTTNGFSVIPIADEEKKLLGILTESDFVGKEVDIPHALVSLKKLFGTLYHLRDIEDVYQNAKKVKLEKVMTKKVFTVTPETTLSEVVDIMVSKHLKRLPVVVDGHLQGIITRKDLLRAFDSVN
ncbi:MAG: CBS domain-containing protein [Bacteriovoracaceae bacterium]|nr:CBS domain-containing protein [Bacteriovoracaceae bacterium]